MRRAPLCTIAVAVLTLAACNPPMPKDLVSTSEELLDTFEDDFDRHHLVSDRAYFDIHAITASEVQDFLENPPYDHPSILATEVMDDGRSFSQALVSIAKAHKLNPLVLLVQVQKEASLISSCSTQTAGCRNVPSRARVNFAFGCGCPDGQGCSSQFKGIDKQLECIANSLEKHQAWLLDEEKDNETLTGWRPGKAKSTLDPLSVNPANRATAVLYTYTPWVLEGSGGNWAFWRIWTKYAEEFGYDQGLDVPFSEGYIGGSCTSDSDCFFAQGECHQGVCVKRGCNNICPDRPGSHYATTFCVTGNDGDGMCVAQCPDDTCGAGQTCMPRSRHNDTGSVADVCLP